MANPGRAVASIGLAFVVFLLGLMVLTGAPIWYLTLRYGSQAVEDSPGGGAIVIGTAPIAAAISLIAAIILGVRFYYRSGKKPKPAKKSRQEDA